MNLWGLTFMKNFPLEKWLYSVSCKLHPKFVHLNSQAQIKDCAWNQGTVKYLKLIQLTKILKYKIEKKFALNFY
jgi:hypothetical protein